jgi:hypothetical protein
MLTISATALQTIAVFAAGGALRPLRPTSRHVVIVFTSAIAAAPRRKRPTNDAHLATETPAAASSVVGESKPIGLTTW